MRKILVLALALGFYGTVHAADPEVAKIAERAISVLEPARAALECVQKIARVFGVIGEPPPEFAVLGLDGETGPALGAKGDKPQDFLPRKLAWKTGR